jgi:uncharacterized protein YndB with AHSA1/START domain
MTAERQRDVSPVVKRIVVKCGADDAFRYFTADFHKWWPGHTHSVIAMSGGGAKRPRSCTLDPRPGGLIVERGEDDERYVWGTITVWDPPRRLQFTWHPGHEPRLAQTIDVTFAGANGSTEVVLTHSGWERLAEDAELARKRYDNGWETVFMKAYRDYANKRQ